MTKPGLTSGRAASSFSSCPSFSFLLKFIGGRAQVGLHGNHGRRGAEACVSPLPAGFVAILEFRQPLPQLLLEFEGLRVATSEASCLSSVAGVGVAPAPTFSGRCSFSPYLGAPPRPLSQLCGRHNLCLRLGEREEDPGRKANEQGPLISERLRKLSGELVNERD